MIREVTEKEIEEFLQSLDERTRVAAAAAYGDTMRIDTEVVRRIAAEVERLMDEGYSADEAERAAQDSLRRWQASLAEPIAGPELPEPSWLERLWQVLRRLLGRTV